MDPSLGRQASVPVATLSAARAGALAFLVAAATLFLQVLVHRIVSAKLLSNYAFLVVSLTMLGFAAAGVVLSLLRDRAVASLSRTAGQERGGAILLWYVDLARELGIGV